MRFASPAREPRLRTLDAADSARASQLRAAVDPARLRDDVERLASAPRNRLHAPDAMRAAEASVRARLEDAGWSVRRQDYRFDHAAGWLDHDFDAADRSVVYDAVEGANLVATVAESRAPSLVVTAHLDTVRDSPGADDNASGVAVLLELARILDPDRLAIRPVLVVTDHEETGFFGARAFANDIEADHLTGALVLESVGYVDRAPASQFLPAGIGLVYRDQVRRLRERGLPGDWTAVIFRERSRGLARLFGEALAHASGRDAAVLVREPLDLPVFGPLLGRFAPWTGDFARSDHAELWRHDVACVQITDTANLRNPHYHQPSDVPATLDWDRLADVVVATALTLERCGRPAHNPAGAIRQPQEVLP